jgi:uncharacterized protein (DUF362 family)/NAD-dependent dihydropyrimidine dehydrogenase PreA subunit
MKPSVALIKCHAYDENIVDTAVREAIDQIGGLASYIHAGQRVLLKPNLVLGAPPETAVCTHPAILKAVALLVLEIGAQPYIGDSPGGPFNAAWVRPMYRKAGWLTVAQETDAVLNTDFTDSYVSIPDGISIKGVELANFVKSADAIITLPKLKTHGLMHITGATKILFGAIPGTEKLAYHAKFPTRDQFADMLIDILFFLRPTLSIMDAVEGMDGTGPTAGTPFKIGAILASTDSVALDIVAAHLVHLDIQDIPPIQAAIRRGISSGKVEDINVVGTSLDNFKIHGFRPPGTHGHRYSILNTLGSNLRSVAKDSIVAAPHATDACIACGICARSCPVQAITISEDRAIMDLNKCIRCYCCHELCPQRAIELKKPLLGRIIGQWR